MKLNRLMLHNKVLSIYKKIPKSNDFWSDLNQLINPRYLFGYAYLIGKLMGDGHLSHNYDFGFVSGDEESLIELKNWTIRNVFLKDKKISIVQREHRGISYLMRVNYSLLGRVLYCLGAPKGNKVKQYFEVPKWIKSNKEYCRMFLKGILEDELRTIKIEKCNYSTKPKFKMSKREDLIDSLRLFLQQVKECVESLGVDCSDVSKYPNRKPDQKTKDLYFDILMNKKNILKFQKNIGFLCNVNKVQYLDECCEVLRNTLKPDVDKNKIIKLREQGMSIREITKKIPHGRTTVHRVIKEACL